MNCSELLGRAHLADTDCIAIKIPQPSECGYSHPEELIEIITKDPKEAHTLYERYRWIFGLLENSFVK
jgi:hypothetical protein